MVTFMTKFSASVGSGLSYSPEWKKKVRCQQLEPESSLRKVRETVIDKAVNVV